MSTRPKDRVPQRQNAVGALRVLSPLVRHPNGTKDFTGPTVPLQPGPDAPYRTGREAATTYLAHNEYMVRLGAQIFAAKAPRHGKVDWWKDHVDTLKLLQFLAKLGDMSCGAVILDQAIFTPAQEKSYVLMLEWPPKGDTDMGGLMGGYWSAFRAATDGPMDEVAAAASSQLLTASSQVVEETAGNRDAQVDPRNQDQLTLPVGVRLPQDYIRLRRVDSILQSLDWSARDGEATYGQGEHIDSRHGAAALGWLHIPPSITTYRPDSPVFPCPFPIVTKVTASQHRPLAATEYKFEYRWLGDVTNPESFKSLKVNGNYASAIRAGLLLRFTNISGSAMNVRGILPLRSFSHSTRAFDLVEGASSDWLDKYLTWSFSSAFQ